MPSRHSSERGTALVGVLLLLLIMTALASALAVSGQTETIVARNHESAAQARAAAEAGLNHASQVLISWIMQWKLRGKTSAAHAMDDLLNGVDAATLADEYELTFGATVAITSQSWYQVYLMDEDDEDRDGYTTLDSLSTAYREDGNPSNDDNDALVIQAVGSGPNGATVRLEAIISPYRLPALAANGDLALAGTAAAIYATDDSLGGVHANGDLTFAGATAIIGIPLELGTATATGECEDCALPTITTNPDGSGGGKGPVAIPSIRASAFRTWADYILTSSGNIEDANGNILADCTPNCSGSGWNFQSKNQEWTLTSTIETYSSGTFYAEGQVTISAGTLLAPAVATIIAEGSITGNGNNYIVPNSGDLLFVTDKDLELGGGFNAGASLNEGQMLVHEQIALSGNAVLFGQIVVENATSTETPDTSSLSGNVVLTNSQDVGSSIFHVSGWREVR